MRLRLVCRQWSRGQPRLVPTCAKRFKAADVRSGGWKGRICRKCNKVHVGDSRSSSGCHNCGWQGHMAKDCRQQDLTLIFRIYYHCDQVVHLKANCPSLDARPAQAPAPSTLRITDGSQDRVEPPRARGCSFHLTAEEARAAPDVMTGMFLSLISLIMFCVMLMCVRLLGMFLVNYLPALVLFESGSSRSFVSRSLCREFDMPIEELECPLQVSIANEHRVFASLVCQGCILEIFWGGLSD